MRRRSFLASVGVAGVAGCLGGGDDGETTTPSSTSTAAPTTTAASTTANTTVTTTHAGPVLGIGDWYSTPTHSVVVDRVWTEQTLQDSTHHRTVSMPEGEALLFVDLRVKNTSDDTRSIVPGRRFGVVVDGAVRPAVASFPHPGVDGEFMLWWLAYADQRRLLEMDGGTVELAPGGFRPVWFAVPVVGDADQLGAAFDAAGGSEFEVWWLPGVD